MKRLFPILLLAAFLSCTPQEEAYPNAEILSFEFNGKVIAESRVPSDVSGSASWRLTFNKALNASKIDRNNIVINGVPQDYFDIIVDSKTLTVSSNKTLPSYTKITLNIYAGHNFGVNIIYDYKLSFVTSYDTSDKFPRISDEELLDKVQKQTFKYFWDYAHPVCGLARERLGSGETVTIGGSGFGIMCIPVGVERGWISREDAAARMRTIVDFLENKADRFHGAYSHWLNGTTGKVYPFSTNDNGGDLVETGFLIEGLLTAKQYFSGADEAGIREAIDRIWRGVEWDWYTRGGQNVLYWHWSPDKDWAMNMKIQGWNEALIVYVLAASSPTHSISADVYHKGWARNGSMKPSQDGPLFFAHYSFLGMDPRGLKDTYCSSYWDQNVAHAQYNYDYCVRNPKNHAGYSTDSWGLTASDIPNGYTASDPTNDRGVIAPTAALASMPYLPEKCMAALHTFYYIYGDKLWGDYGFRDAFCLDKNWFAPSYIAIDQGPIVLMIENYRTGLLWNLFMADKDVQKGLTRLGFEFQAGE